MFPVVANELNKVRRYKSTKQASNQTDRNPWISVPIKGKRNPGYFTAISQGYSS